MAKVVSRLALVMQILGVTGYDVALALDIDPSLISKWKRNRRRVPGRSDTMSKIAGFLLEADEKQDGQALKPMLENLAGGPVSREQAVELLTLWLLDSEQSAWLSDVEDMSRINLDHNSYTCPIEVFSGTAGRRSAVLRFFETIRTLPADCTLQLLIQEDAVWSEASPEFQSRFNESIADWTASGHRLEAIHWIDQKPERLQSIVQHWLPLHLDATLNTLYFPIYGKNILPMIIFMVPGHLAVVGHNSGEQDAEYHTILYADRASIRQFGWVFGSIRQNCLALVENYPIKSIPLLLTRFAENWRQVRNKYISLHSRLPLLIGLPADKLGEILADNGIDAGRQAELLDEWKEFLRSRQPGNQVRLVHNLDAIEHVMAAPDYVDPFLSSLAGRPIRVRRKYSRASLLALSHDIQENDNLKLALVRSETFERMVWPNLLIVSGAFLAAWGDKKSQNRVFSQEATLVHAFEQYFAERWQQIPRVCRERDVVLPLLVRLAGEEDRV